MGRVLSVARTSVAAPAEAEYVATVGELAARLARRGESLWLFRHPTQGGAFLEFSESASADRHRSRAERPAGEAELERRLRALATYSSDAGELWEEVPLRKA